MRGNIAAVAILVAVLFLQPAIPFMGSAASAAPPLPAGRAGPPVNGSTWDIAAIQNITTDIDFAGNITIYANAQLRILGHARLRITPNPSFHYLILVKPGGSIQVENNSILEADNYYAESGTGFNVLSGSTVKARGLLEAYSSCYINDSTITVTSAPGVLPGEAGQPARLILDPGGQIKNCVITVSAGDGASSQNGTGIAGGAGGDASMVMKSREISNVRTVVRSGHGGNGGAGGGSSVNGGPGGKGGNIALRMTGDILAKSVITGITGYGGNGSIGANPGSGDGGQGGRGGDGGSADMRWSGKAIDISSSNLSIITGNAGRGGDGGVAQRNGNGGSGGDGGTGGSLTAAIDSKGTFTITDSALNFWAGYGPTGGNYGRAMVAGNIDGRAGEGGTGGSSTCDISLIDTFTSTNSSIHVSAGNAGSGGAGSAAAKGGTGGTGRLSFSIAAQNTEPTFSYLLRSLVSRGGKGGDGGRGQGTGQTPGQPGDGGKGGGARIEIVSTSDIKSVDINDVEVACDPGAPGSAIYPAKTGNPGVGEIFFMTKSLLARNSTVTQRMGPVDNNDYWRFESTVILESEPFNVSEAGVAEAYYVLGCVVKDVNGNIITDGSVTVEITQSGATSPGWVKRTDSFGKAEFLLLGARYVANPEETVRIVSYVAQAFADDGNYTKPLSVQLTGDKVVDLFLIQKSHLPTATIDSPNDKLTAILYATNFLRANGTAEPFLIDGTAADSVFNSVQSISSVEIMIGDGPWTPVNLTMPTFNAYKWTYSWDIYNWALDQLTRYPLGIIPAPIVARANNERFFSTLFVQNITVYLLRIPGPLPEIVISRPVLSTDENINSTEVGYEKMVPFDARVVNSTGTRVIKWAWCFDDSNGYREDYSSPYFPSTNVSYMRDQNDKYMFVILKVFDNESARRVELIRGGVSYSEFKYDFDQNDGSTTVKLRMHILPIPPPPPPTPFEQYKWYIISSIVVLALMTSAVMVFRLRTKQIIERREKEDRESLRVEVPDTHCARCGEPLADPAAGCLQCRAQDTLSVVQQSILRLKDAGVNIMDAEKVLEEGVDAFDSKSFQEAIVKANAAKEKATQLENKYTETSSLITGWETKVSQIRVNTPEADLTEPETKVYHARLALGRGDHAGVAKSLEGLEPLLEKASKAGMKKGTQELIESTGRMIANIEKRGVILDKKVGAVVDQANFALDQSEYELAQEHCKEAEALVKDTNRLFIKASTAIRQSETRVTDAKGTAKPFGTTEDLLRQARDAMTAGNYSSVTDITGRILGFFGVSASAPTPRKVDWKKEVAIVGGPKAAPATAGPQPASRPATASGQPLPLLEMDFSPDQKDLADKMMKEAAEAIALAREQAVDVSDGEDLLAKARDAYMARRFPEASELSKSAKFLMAELAGAAGAKPRPKMAAPVAAKAPAQAAAPTTAATEPKLSIDKAEALIARLSEMGADVSGLETMLMRSKSARDGGSPVVALQFAKDVLSQGEDLLKQYETAKKNFALAEKVLDVARSRNLDTADAEFQLRQARNAMAGGAFGRVADTATLVLTMLKELDPTLENAAMAAAPAAAMPAPAPAPSTVASPPTQAPAAPATAPPAPAPADTIPCPGCTRPIKPSWKSCPFCGAKIVPAGEKPAAAPAAAPPTVAPPAPAPVPVTAPSTVTPAALSPAPVPAAAPPTMTAAAPASAPLPVAPKAPPVITRPAIMPPAPPSSAGPICPKCRSTVKPHWKVCPSCGSALAPSSPVEPAAAGAAKALADAQRCPACGARITPGMTACPLCKTPLLSDKGARPEPEPPKKVVTVTKPVISPPASAPSAAPRPPAAAPTAAPKPPVAAPPAPPKPLIVPPTPAPAPAAPEKYDAAKKPVLKVVRKKVVVKKKGDEEE